MSPTTHTPLDLNVRLSENVYLGDKKYKNYKTMIFERQNHAVPVFVNTGLGYIKKLIQEKLRADIHQLDGLAPNGRRKELTTVVHYLFGGNFDFLFHQNKSEEEQKTAEFYKQSIITYCDLLEKIRHYFSHYWRKEEEIVLNDDETALIDGLHELAIREMNKRKKDQKESDPDIEPDEFDSEENIELYEGNKLTIFGALFLCCISLLKGEAHQFLSQTHGFKRTSKQNYRRSLFTALCLREKNKKDTLKFDKNKDWLLVSILAELNRMPQAIQYHQNQRQSEKLKKAIIENKYDEDGSLINEDEGIGIRKYDHFLQLAVLYLDLFVLKDYFRLPFTKAPEELSDADNLKVGDKYEWGRNKEGADQNWYKLTGKKRITVKIGETDTINNIHYLNLSKKNITELLLLHFAFDKDINDMLVVAITTQNELHTNKRRDRLTPKEHAQNSHEELLRIIERDRKRKESGKMSYFKINATILHYLQKMFALGDNNKARQVNMFNKELYDRLRTCLIYFKRKEYREKFWELLKADNNKQYLFLIKNNLREAEDIHVLYEGVLDTFGAFLDKMDTTEQKVNQLIIDPFDPKTDGKKGKTYKKATDKYEHSIQNNFTIPIRYFLRKYLNGYENGFLPYYQFMARKMFFVEEHTVNGKKSTKPNFYFPKEFDAGSFFQIKGSRLYLKYHQKAFVRINKKISDELKDPEETEKLQNLDDDKQIIRQYCLQDALLLCMVEKCSAEIEFKLPEDFTSFYDFYHDQAGTVRVTYGGVTMDLDYKDAQKHATLVRANIVEAFYDHDNIPKNFESLHSIRKKYFDKQRIIVQGWQQIEKKLFDTYKEPLKERRAEDGANNHQGDFRRLLRLDFANDKPLVIEEGENIEVLTEMRNKALHYDINDSFFDDNRMGQFV